MEATCEELSDLRWNNARDTEWQVIAGYMIVEPDTIHTRANGAVLWQDCLQAAGNRSGNGTSNALDVAADHLWDLGRDRPNVWDLGRDRPDVWDLGRGREA